MVIEVILKDGRKAVTTGLIDEPLESGLLGAIVDEMIFNETEFYKPAPKCKDGKCAPKNLLTVKPLKK